MRFLSHQHHSQIIKVSEESVVWMIEGQAIVEFPFIHETDDHTARRGFREADWNSKDLRANKPIYLYMAVFYVKIYDPIEFFEQN